MALMLVLVRDMQTMASGCELLLMEYFYACKNVCGTIPRLNDAKVSFGGLKGMHME